ncbi:MAG TPA: hypothetical protein PK393_10990, partial [Synergistaceae bacterium]|nr:hypothetical protein [Synergistaceae bacterium]
MAEDDGKVFELPQERGMILDWEEWAGVPFMVLDDEGRCIRLGGLGSSIYAEADSEGAFVHGVEGAEDLRREVWEAARDPQGKEVSFRARGRWWRGAVLPVILASGRRGALVVGTKGPAGALPSPSSERNGWSDDRNESLLSALPD